MAFTDRDSLPAWLETLSTARGRIVFPDIGIDMPYRELARRAAGFAEVLRGKGIGAGEVVGVLAPTGPEFLVGFFGVLWAGGTASVLPIPTLGVDLLQKLHPLMSSIGMQHVVVAEVFGRAAAELQVAEHLAVLPIDIDAAVSTARPYATAPTAVIQLTSGSIADPKAVQISHSAYLSGFADVRDVCRLSAEDVVALWLPLSHDFGLNTLLCAMSADADVHLVNPYVFIRDPAEFLRYMERARATIFASPNFAYDRLVAAAEELPPAEFDLSSWRMAWNGGEVVRAQTVTRFAEAFARFGVREPVMSPAYGMAEVAAPIAGWPATPGLRIVSADRDSLGRGDRIRLSSDDGAARLLVSNGPAFGRSMIRIVDASGAVLPDETIGEIEVRSPSLTSGYRNNAAATAAAFHGDWLRTGDIGLLLDGELYVTGRVKDMVIVAGRNFHAEDVEEIAGRTPGVHRGHCAVVADVEQERLVVVVEVPADLDGSAVATAVRARTQEQLQLADICVYPVGRGWLPRTTSGKWQRHKLLSRLAAEARR